MEQNTNVYEQTIEECAELIVAIRHYQRNKDSSSHMIEEATHVWKMVNLLRQTFPEEWEQGLAITEERLKNNKERVF